MYNIHMTEIIGEYKSFFDDLYDRLKAVGIDITGYPLSHLGIKFASFEEYNNTRDALKSFSRSFAENEHNGRPVAFMWLKEPLQLSHDFTCELLELMPPKPNNQYPTGLEHLGVIIGKELDKFGITHQAVLSGRQNQGPINKPFYISFDNGTRVKFYNLSMQEVLAGEGSSFVPL